MIHRIDLQTALYGEKTYLKKDYFTRPFKLLPVSIDPADPWLKVMVMSSSPGMLEGDQYDIRVELTEGTRLRLETQSYQRIFKMQSGARQEMTVTMAPNSRFYYIPHPSVPHQDSIFRSQNRIQLDSGCRLIWGEIVTCGRKLSGEEFRFTHFQSRTDVFWHKKVIFIDHLLLSPNTMTLQSLLHYEGFTHQATLFFFDEHLSMPTLIDSIYELVKEDSTLAFGISQTAHHGLLMRFLGTGGEQLYTLLHRIGAFLNGL